MENTWVETETGDIEPDRQQAARQPLPFSDRPILKQTACQTRWPHSHINIQQPLQTHIKSDTDAQIYRARAVICCSYVNGMVMIKVSSHQRVKKNKKYKSGSAQLTSSLKHSCKSKHSPDFTRQRIPLVLERAMRALIGQHMLGM